MLSTGTSFVLLLYISGIFCGSLKDLPEECFTDKYIEESTRAFDTFNVPTSRANDLELKKGWYKIIGKDVNSLKQGYDRPLRSGSIPPNFCGTEQAGTLMGEHPVEKEGAVEMTVCFRERYCFFEDIKGSKGCDCKSNVTVYVRNCRIHYVYWLSPTSQKQRYCTGRSSLKGAKIVNKTSTAIECMQHSIISQESSRVWDEVDDVTCDHQAGWFRFDDQSGYEISSNCSINDKSVTRFGQPCGAEFRGWMVDQHPKLEDGRVTRRICFSYADHCVCDFFGNIAVRNCGSFYVYRLPKTPTCNARYCGAVRGSSAEVNDLKKPPVIDNKDICKMYKVSYDPDRLWSYTNPTVSKCDASLYGKYRFGSLYTPWRIKEGCNASDMHVITHRCGTGYQGYMEGVHPTERDGYVEKVICFQSTTVPCECQYTAIVGVKNCGGFYVYNIKSVPQCDSRYCMVANDSAAIIIDPGRAPLYEIPVPGYKPPPKTKQDKDDKYSGLVTSTTVLAIIVLFVIILLIILIIVIVFLIWPIYRQHEPRSRRRSSEQNQLVAPVELESEAKPSSSNGQVQKEEKVQDFEESPIPPYPSVPPPSAPVVVQDDDSEIEMQRGPGSEDDLKTIPEDTEFSDTADESDTLMRKEDMRRPKSYDSKDSAV